MKRKLLVILLSLVCIFCLSIALTACQLGGGNNNEGKTGSCEHVWSSWTTTKEATCSEKGERQHTCSVCGKTEKQDISTIGHNFNDQNVCTICGYELNPTVGLEYELVEERYNSYYIVKGIGNADAREIVIPASHAGKQVTQIAEKAFYGSDFITSVYLPNTINSIGQEAFYWCENLTQLIISNPTSNTLDIGEKAFYGCIKLNSVALPKKLTSIYADTFENTGFYNNISNWQNGILNLDGWILKVDETSSTELTLSTEVGIANYALKNSNITTLNIKNSDIKFLEYSVTNSKVINVSLPASLISYLPASQIVELTINSGTLSSRALNGFSYLEKLTIPYLSGNIHYLFGTQEFSNSTAIQSGYYMGGWYRVGTENYYVPSNLKEVTISSGAISEGAFSECSMIEKITLGDKVSSIGSVAFAGCTSLKNVTIPDRVTVIYNYTFRYCTSLKSVTIGSSSQLTHITNYAFYNCTSLESITIPDSVTYIGRDAFYNCTSLNVYITDIASWCNIEFEINSMYAAPVHYAYNLYLNNKLITKLEIPDSVTSIGNNVFEGCTSLTSITIPNSVTSIGNYAFSGCTNLTSIIIPDSVTSIDNSAFRNCTNLTSVTIPDSVTSIGDGAFYDCTSITSIIIPDSVTSIDNSAFRNCTNLTSIIIPDSVTSIGSYAFYGCTSLTSITIPDSVTSIGGYAFYGCTSLNALYITDIAHWCNISFGDSYSNPLYYAHNLYLNNKLVTELEIPDSVTSIGDYVFFSCKSLTSITIPNSVTSIGKYAFLNCTNLTSVTIPDSVTSIGEGAFYNCTNLTSITIPDSVTSIDNLRSVIAQTLQV